MRLRIEEKNGIKIVVVHSDEVLIADVAGTLDFMASVQYEADTRRIALNKAALAETLFDLSTRVFGEILQKFSNYRMKLAIIGDFSIYPSKSLRDFIYECNNGHDIFFVKDEDEAVERLANA